MSVEVPAGSINVMARDEMGRPTTRQVAQTVAVGPRGEPVQVKTEDGRTIIVSRKVAHQFPELFAIVKDKSE